MPSDTIHLRLLDISPIEYEGATYLHLRDPLRLSEGLLLVPQPMAPALFYMDGTRDSRQIRQALLDEHHVRIPEARIRELVDHLDAHYLLENEKYQNRRKLLTNAFRQNGRKSVMLDPTRANNPDDLVGVFDTFVGSAGEITPVDRVKMILSPHIDYERGGTVYARTWQTAAGSIRQAKRMIFLGTDHFSEGLPFSLTRTNFITPLGTLPVDQDGVDQLEEIIGGDAFRGELHHRSEHSIELALHWAQYIRGGEPFAFIPVLCGPLLDDLNPQANPPVPSMTMQVISALRVWAKDEHTIIIAAGDLSHVGPAFGGSSVNQARHNQLIHYDQTLLAAMRNNNPDEFHQVIRLSRDQNNVCGVTPIVLAMKASGATTTHIIDYAVCPADTTNTSFVTICGAVFN